MTNILAEKARAHRDQHRERAVNRAREAVHWLATQGYTAQIVGSLARGKDFSEASDVDFLIYGDAGEDRFRLEGKLCEIMQGMEFSIIPFEAVFDPFWVTQLRQDAVDVSQLLES